jgi:AcrR family transcriptional regulator
VSERQQGQGAAGNSAAPSVSATREPGNGRTAASDRVVQAGIKLFSESGFLATTIRDITRECGLAAVASFYNHFESKWALLNEIIREANEHLEGELEQLSLDALTPSEALQALVRTLVTFNLTRPREARIANREYGFLQSPDREDVIDHRRRVRALFESAVASAGPAQGLLVSRSGAEQMETRLLAISIINLSIASSEWYHPDGLLSVSDVADTYCRLALRMACLPGPPQSA